MPITNRLQRIKRRYQEKGTTKFADWSSADKAYYLETVRRKKMATKQQKLSPYLDKKKALLRFAYVRYADDWVFFTNCSKERTELIKERLAQFLEERLGLKLSPEKTKITNAKKERVKFLGFSLCYYADSLKIKKVSGLSKIKERFNKQLFRLVINKGKGISHKRRTTGNLLVIGIDQDRLDQRLIFKKFVDETGKRGHRKAEWTVLSDYEIIMRYNFVIRGLVNYYGSTIRDFSIVNKYIYLLNYSCLHTLANKHRSSIRKIIAKYGLPAKATQTTKKKGKELEKTIRLLDYQECKRITKELSEKERKEDVDFLQVRVNWRTVYKLGKHCVMCGSTEKLQMHHVKHVRKMGKTLEGFGQVIAALSRRQICVCYTCHRRIHLGLYDRMRLTDLYDPDLSTL